MFLQFRTLKIQASGNLMDQSVIVEQEWDYQILLVAVIQNLEISLTWHLLVMIRLIFKEITFSIGVEGL